LTDIAAWANAACRRIDADGRAGLLKLFNRELGAVQRPSVQWSG
jgi:hypothetical protein